MSRQSGPITPTRLRLFSWAANEVSAMGQMWRRLGASASALIEEPRAQNGVPAWRKPST